MGTDVIVQLLDKSFYHLAETALHNRLDLECLDGNTNNICIFHLPYFSPVWYYNPITSFLVKK